MDWSAAFPMHDFLEFREAGLAVLGNESAYHNPGSFYPLPIVIWLFVPIALLPLPAAAILWQIASLASVWVVLKRPAPIYFVSYAMLLNLRWGQVDALLTVPMALLIRNIPNWAGCAAAVLLLKPQVSWAVVVYMFGCWVITREWRQLRAFAATAFVLCLPAFVIEPAWVMSWLGNLRRRASFEIDSFWTLSVTLGCVLVVAALWLIWTARDRGKLVNLAALALTPSLFMYDYVMVTASLPPSYRLTSFAAVIGWAIPVLHRIFQIEHTSLYGTFPFLLLGAVWLQDRRSTGQASPFPRGVSARRTTTTRSD